MEIPAPPDLSVELGPDGFAFQLSHPLAPAAGAAREPVRQVALAYLNELARARYLPLSASDLDYLRNTADGARVEASADTRLVWLPERQIIRNGEPEATIVLIQQLAWWKNPVPIEGRGIRIVCQHDAKRDVLLVTGASSTLRQHQSLSDAAKKISVEWFPFDPVTVAKLILAPAFGLDAATLTNADTQLVAFDPTDDRSRTAVGAGDAAAGELTIGYKLACSRTTRRGDAEAFRAFYDLATGRTSERQVLASACSGLNFSLDPVSKSGSAWRGPDSPGDRLDPLRDTCHLHDLATSPDGQLHLSGPRVAIKDPNPLGFDPPTTEASKPSFDFHARTNEFAAVSAYAHCDAMMRMIESFGFDLAAYFPTLPITVVHRAPLRLTSAAHDGKAVAAYVQAVRDAPLALEMCFALANLTDPCRNPLGVAADVRWVWHELSHVLLAACTGEIEFRFAHSAGDALAAIMCDADSKLAWDDGPGGWRGLTFPFVSSPLRRHDRDVNQGWGWTGSLYDAPPHYPSARDPGGYRGEQLLSSTLFRLYRAAGGDASHTDGTPDRSRRRAAARYVVYLVVRAINSLGPASATPAQSANVFANSLVDADIGTRLFTDGQTSRLGGTLHKVVRWAFQQQGLYRTNASQGRDTPGDHPPVDIYIERNGAHPKGYDWAGDWRAKSSAVCVRNARDAGTTDEVPRKGVDNFVYVEVGNQGTADTSAVSVDVLTRAGPGHEIWDTSGDWTVVPPAPGAVVQSNVDKGTKVRFGPFIWTPNSSGRHGIFVRSTAVGDRSNADATSFLACAAGPIGMQDLVPFDNNLGYRSWRLQ